MSSGTNTERITQNNTKISTNNTAIDNFKTAIQNLPSKTQKVVLPDKIKFSSSGSTNMEWLENTDISNITDMYNMFSQCAYLTNLNLEGFITSNVTSIGSMFSGCVNLESINLNNCDTSNVSGGLNDLFANCRKLDRIDISSFTIKENHSVDYNLHRIFDGCTNLKYIDISGLDFTGFFNNHNNIFRNVPTDCLIYVKDQNAVDKLTSWDSTHTYTIKQ